jgi:hypothetical protein
MALQDIKENIARDIREPVLNVCLTIVDRLAKIKPDQLQRLTYTILADFAERKPDDEIFLSALTALTTIKHNPITLYFLFYDFEDDCEIKISASEAIQSVDDGLFIHPRTGEDVKNFANQLKPVYKASEEFINALVVGNGH